MMLKNLALLILLMPVSGWCLNIDKNSVTVSGISSGAFMAAQLQFTHPDEFQGVALMAGGLYGCAEGNPVRAINSCMQTSVLTPSVDELGLLISNRASRGQIGSLKRIAEHRVLLITGKSDTVVHPDIVKTARSLYRSLGIQAQNLQLIDNLNLGHAIPTMEFGNPCDTPAESPFISRCRFDGAGEILQFLYPDISMKRGEALESGLMELTQKSPDLQDPEVISMDDSARVYVPVSCRQGQKCRLHVALHGCSQSQSEIGDAYYGNAGFNQWAEANNIVVLYPQTVRRMLLGNPMGCWDWYGYTGPDYDLKGGPQINALMNLIGRVQQMDFPEAAGKR